jgi:hypothetical protein
LVLMPHGMDQLWRSPRGSFSPPLNSLLGQRLFSIPAMADQLSHRMRELTNTVFRPQFVDGVFSNAQYRLRERLILEGREAELPPVQRAVDSTLQRTRQRMAAFVGQRYQPPQPGEFDNEGRMRLTDWSSSSPEQEGYATRIEADEDPSVFRITASAADGRTSLHKRILLAPGLYQWEARVRTRSVSGFGACLDVEWGRRGQRFDEGSTPLQSVTGTTDWTLLKREISIPARGEGGRRRPGGPMGENGSSPREILLHAELRADSGTAEFDADAFVLRKR